jgi:hypothetical protein
MDKPLRFLLSQELQLQNNESSFCMKMIYQIIDLNSMIQILHFLKDGIYILNLIHCKRSYHRISSWNLQFWYEEHLCYSSLKGPNEELMYHFRYWDKLRGLRVWILLTIWGKHMTILSIIHDLYFQWTNYWFQIRKVYYILLKYSLF